MNEELINQYSIFTHTDFKIVTKDGEDLTEDLRGINPPVFDGR